MKRKIKITPLLVLLNLLFIGVPVVLLVIDRDVFIYNAVTAIGVILIAMLVRRCFFKNFNLSDLSNYLFIFMSLWLSALMIWVTVVGNLNSEYKDVSIIENNYLNIIAGVLIGCNPVILAFAFTIVCLACVVALGLAALACAVALAAVAFVLYLVFGGIYYGMRFLYRQCKKCCK